MFKTLIQVTDIIMSEPQEHNKTNETAVAAPTHWVNRGFMFVDFATHIHACEFKKKMQLRLIAPFGKPLPNVDWAEPIVKPDDDALAKVGHYLVIFYHIKTLLFVCAVRSLVSKSVIRIYKHLTSYVIN